MSQNLNSTSASNANLEEVEEVKEVKEEEEEEEEEVKTFLSSNNNNKNNNRNNGIPSPLDVYSLRAIDLAPRTMAIMNELCVESRGSISNVENEKNEKEVEINRTSALISQHPISMLFPISSSSDTTIKNNSENNNNNNNNNNESPLSYKELLQRHNEELQKATLGFKQYSEDTAKLFKKNPPEIPEHLLNRFTDTNVIVAKDHKGRLDKMHEQKQSQTLKYELHPNYDESNGVLVHMPFRGSESEEENNNNNNNETNEINLISSPENISSSFPRFTIHSLPNGDIRPRDALKGKQYWNAMEPQLPKCVLPSKLLEERTNEAFHNYRYYSHRWRMLLEELAAAIGGDVGAELIRRYELREEALPLPPKCQRAFYESVVDYDLILKEQERIMEAVEQDLADYRANLLDSPPALL